jgi:hypothetical protein
LAEAWVINARMEIERYIRNDDGLWIESIYMVNAREARFFEIRKKTSTEKKAQRLFFRNFRTQFRLFQGHSCS